MMWWEKLFPGRKGTETPSPLYFRLRNIEKCLRDWIGPNGTE